MTRILIGYQRKSIGLVLMRKKIVFEIVGRNENSAIAGPDLSEQLFKKWIDDWLDRKSVV